MYKKTLAEFVVYGYATACPILPDTPVVSDTQKKQTVSNEEPLYRLHQQEDKLPDHVITYILQYLYSKGIRHAPDMAPEIRCIHAVPTTRAIQKGIMPAGECQWYCTTATDNNDQLKVYVFKYENDKLTDIIEYESNEKEL